MNGRAVVGAALVYVARMWRGVRLLLPVVIVAGLLPGERGIADTVDGEFDGSGRVAAGSVTELQVAGRGGVPGDATFAVVNITVTETAAPGYVSAYPCDVARPNASTLNYLAGDTVPNAAVVELSTTGSVCLYSSAATHLIVDVSGYFAAATSVVAIGPLRLMDSRSGTVSATYDGRFRGIGPLRAGSTTALQVVGRAEVQEATRVALLNVTATEVSAPGYVTLWPCDRSRPLVSNLNVAPGRTVANLAVANLSKADGTVCLYVSAEMELVVDIVGYVDPPAGVRAPPMRLMDSRIGAVSETIDGLFEDLGILPAGTTTELVATDRSLLPSVEVAGVIMNVTATDPEAPGYITVHPCDEPRPLASNVNFTTGQTTSNTVWAWFDPTLGPETVCLYNSAATHLVVDAVAWIDWGRDRPVRQWGSQGLTPERLLDTRSPGSRWQQHVVDADVVLDEFDDSGPNDVVAVECVAPHRCYVVTGSPLNMGFRGTVLVTDDGWSWDEQVISGSDDVPTDIDCPSPDVCYVTIYPYWADSGVAITRDGGKTWGASVVATDDGGTAGVYPSSIHCPNDDVCFVSDEVGVFRTDDGGEHWVLVEDVIGPNRFIGARCPSAGVCYARSGSEVLRSTDGRHSWDVVLDATKVGHTNASIDALDCPTSAVCHAAASWFDGAGGLGGSFFTTTNSGMTWVERTAPAGGGPLRCDAAGACVLVTTDESGLRSIHRTDDAGATWEFRHAVPEGLLLSCAGPRACMTITRSTFDGAVVSFGSPP
jgi:photosystem II stability/assembly factor-like uncharacterized protein